MNERKNCSIRTNTQRQRDYSDRCESGTLAQLPHSVFEVLHQGSHRNPLTSPPPPLPEPSLSSCYSSRNVSAGSIRAIRKVGTVVAINVANASTTTTKTIVGASYTPIP